MKRSLLFLLLVLLSRADDTHPEIDALTAFKLNLHDPLGALTSWDPSTPSAPCDWRGVFCTNRRVTEIRLPRLQLSGRISDRISDLGMLRKLSLRSNSFNGTIPPSLAFCTRLLAVFLQYNSLTGKLPPGMKNLTELEVFNVSGNRLSGEISAPFPTSLKFLDLSSNVFSGTVPSGLANLTQLQLLNLSYNQLDVSRLTQLLYILLNSISYLRCGIIFILYLLTGRDPREPREASEPTVSLARL